MEQQIELKIKKDYNEYTGPRYCVQGSSSGEEFYHTLLNELFAQTYKENKILVVDLDDTAGYLSSFLDEAFGNLVFDFTVKIVKPRLKIVSTQEPDWERMIVSEVYSDWEKRRVENIIPRKTIKHPEWFKLIENELIKKVWL